MGATRFEHVTQRLLPLALPTELHPILTTLISCSPCTSQSRTDSFGASNSASPKPYCHSGTFVVVMLIYDCPLLTALCSLDFFQGIIHPTYRCGAGESRTPVYAVQAHCNSHYTTAPIIHLRLTDYLSLEISLHLCPK